MYISLRSGNYINSLNFLGPATLVKSVRIHRAIALLVYSPKGRKFLVFPTLVVANYCFQPSIVIR